VNLIGLSRLGVVRGARCQDERTREKDRRATVSVFVKPIMHRLLSFVASAKRRTCNSGGTSFVQVRAQTWGPDWGQDLSKPAAGQGPAGRWGRSLPAYRVLAQVGEQRRWKRYSPSSAGHGSVYPPSVVTPISSGHGV